MNIIFLIISFIIGCGAGSLCMGCFFALGDKHELDNRYADGFKDGYTAATEDQYEIYLDQDLY